ncbi:hypothetical protein O9H85_19360 [Paenibacillus filicis]|uniref:Uncharacterized protein n=1 Tax=Paenibacillus gyeongsangnamensis TaxID=3388067 RepID=A0ABT4QCF1_9BACL|nr:hypothetical protein [Paenibacillus filicis]MCZ8514541.1 hypothetical protein [Paenibacillus filicis]
MSRKKTLPSISKPFAHVHSTLSALGFCEQSSREGTQYELTFRDPATLQEYPFRVYTHTQENGTTLVNLAEAGFLTESVPDAAKDAAKQVMSELLQYLENDRPKLTPIHEAMNGRMASNEAEVIKLGKSMNNYPTNSQLLEIGMVPDPMQ